MTKDELRARLEPIALELEEHLQEIHGGHDMNCAGTVLCMFIATLYDGRGDALHELGAAAFTIGRRLAHDVTGVDPVTLIRQSES